MEMMEEKKSRSKCIFIAHLQICCEALVENGHNERRLKKEFPFIDFVLLVTYSIPRLVERATSTT